jgi:penicillin amidase
MLSLPFEKYSSMISNAIPGLKKTVLTLLCAAAASAYAQSGVNNSVPGLQLPVEVLRDKWGVNHIYASNQHDLFFMQGYLAAKDRLFQFEIWRRQATGTVSELTGPSELKRDIGARLFKYRGDLDKELNYYHKDGKAILEAYTDGVNSYIDEVLKNPTLLPQEFKILGIKPGKWTPEIVVSRHQGLKGNVAKELEMGMAVAKAGEHKVKELAWLHPKDPDLRLDPSITKEMLFKDILEVYNRFHSAFPYSSLKLEAPFGSAIEPLEEGAEGSNNWIVSGSRTQSGAPILANDPHRAISLPSLRYMAHLNAPGWNVIGGGEPVIPGISIGHNDFGAWGLTIFQTDSEDLMVYDLNPDKPGQYKYKGKWRDMEEVHETIPIKGRADTAVTLLFTVHGPVTYVDAARNKAYAVRCGWLEPGGAPYLASLRYNQAKNWNQFRQGAKYSNLPGENMIWADKKGNIGWQVVGITPLRKNFSGLVPVPGDGRFEWDGFLNIKKRPHSYNPKSGFFATANQNVTPETYRIWEGIGYTWADPFRGDRINEVLAADDKVDIAKTVTLQSDYLSIPARTLVPMLSGIRLPSEFARRAQEQFKGWDFTLNENSTAAAIYVMWERRIESESNARFVPQEIKGLVSVQLNRTLSWLKTPDDRFGTNPEQGRNEFLSHTFELAIKDLQAKLGDNISQWKYGQEKYKHAALNHSLNSLLSAGQKEKFNIKALPRGGNGHTPNSTGGADRQTSGASFRLIADLSDWDKALMINSPGQSADPESKYYQNLFELWAKNEYFPAYFSKEKIIEVTDVRTVFEPVK